MNDLTSGSTNDCEIGGRCETRNSQQLNSNLARCLARMPTPRLAIGRKTTTGTRVNNGETLLYRARAAEQCSDGGPTVRRTNAKTQRQPLTLIRRDERNSAGERPSVQQLAGLCE
jgi:hypothetical protein